MRIIDSLIVNQLFELDLFYLKVLIESPCVDEFVVNECAYDYRGRFKGLVWKHAVSNDSRFDPYWDRITFNEINRNLSGIDPNSIGSSIDPPQCAVAEWDLRDAPIPYLLDKYSGRDRVFTSDVDEVIDFADVNRRDRLLTLLRSDRMLQIERIRFSYDYHVRSHRSAGDVINPCYQIGHLRRGEARLRDKKWLGDLIPVGDNPLVFEYCHVFRDREDVQRKHDSSLHTQWSRPKIDTAIDTATWPQTSYQGNPDRNNRWHWFEAVELHERNSPRYIRENFDRLKTNLVPDNYRENRLKRFGHDGVHQQNLSEL